jgi:hypothetical protein
MPAVSKAQRRLMVIAEHHPEKIKGSNRGILKMSHNQLHDFASTKEKGLPKKKVVKEESIGAFIKRRNALKGGK